MRDFREAKAMASTLRDELATRGVQLSRADCLEIMAKALGAADWNTLSARTKAQVDEPSDRDFRQQTWPEIARPFYNRHLTPEERSGRLGGLIKEAQALYAATADPGSDEVLDLARRWIDLSHAVTGDNDELRAKYAAAYKEALADPRVAPNLPLSRELLVWLSPALASAKSAREEGSAQPRA